MDFEPNTEQIDWITRIQQFLVENDLENAIKSELNIADELSHLCGVLRQSMRKNEPPSAEWRARTVK